LCGCDFIHQGLSFLWCLIKSKSVANYEGQTGVQRFPSHDKTWNDSYMVTTLFGVTLQGQMGFHEILRFLNSSSQGQQPTRKIEAKTSVTAMNFGTVVNY